MKKNHCTTIIDISDLYAKPDTKLIDHLYSVGFMAEALLKFGRGKHFINTFSERKGIDKKELIDSICFLCALHDIGKAHPGFQKNLSESKNYNSDSFNNLLSKGMILEMDENIRHERYSREIIEDYLYDKGLDDIDHYAYTLAYHHRGKDINNPINRRVYCYKKEDNRWNEWHNVHLEIIEKIEENWKFSEKMADFSENGLDYFILSTMVVADWITSGSMWNNEYIKREKDLFSIAKDFIYENQLNNKPVEEVFNDFKWDDVFDYPMNELQEKISTLDLKKIKLLLLEYPCGYGKTNAALLAAIRMGIGIGGIYFATPTTQTAKAIVDGFRKLAEKAGFPISIPEFDSSMICSKEDIKNRIPAYKWVSKPMHQFLYPYAVGTIDQLLKSVLNFRYNCISLMGLADKVIIVDEIHAYDAYMLEELETLIKWCNYLGVPVILLSATLPTKTKERLFKAVNGGKPCEISDTYPLISVINEKKELIQETTDCSGKIFNIRTIKGKNIEDIMYEQASNIKEGCAGIIMPTVDMALNLYDRLYEELKEDVVVFHGRDTIEGKTIKTNKLLNLLGRERKYRPKRLIVVSTAIIEQSLDIDFDMMFTSIAPIDLLIQRMGRVWRHDDEGTIREKEDIKYPFTVVIPEEYGILSRYIYYDDILSETEKVLTGLTQIDTVKDVRPLIDKVYNIDIPDRIIKELSAGRQCLNSPYEEDNLICSNDSAYRKFDPIMATTRDESYPTVKIAIIKELKDKYSEEEVQEIKYKNVVSIPKYRSDLFTPTETDNEYFKDTLIYVSEDLSISENGKTMALTKDGLRFYNR